MRAEALSSLKEGGAGLAAIDSAMASLLMVKAYSKKEGEKVEEKLCRMEQNSEHRVAERWRSDSADYKAGLAMLRKRTLTRWVHGSELGYQYVGWTMGLAG